MRDACCSGTKGSLTVREALVGSVTNTSASAPPFKRYVNQESTVPKASRPSSYACLTFSTCFRSHNNFVDEGYVESGRPQRFWSLSAPSCLFNSCTILCVRVSVHTIELYSGSPVFLSQTQVVSRWLVMPTALMSCAEWPCFSNVSTAPSMQVWTEFTRSYGSCSCHLKGVNVRRVIVRSRAYCLGGFLTYPDWGYICLNSSWCVTTTSPRELKIRNLELVVPWSMAPMKA